MNSIYCSCHPSPLLYSNKHTLTSTEQGCHLSQLYIHVYIPWTNTWQRCRLSLIYTALKSTVPSCQLSIYCTYPQQALHKSVSNLYWISQSIVHILLHHIPIFPVKKETTNSGVSGKICLNKFILKSQQTNVVLGPRAMDDKLTFQQVFKRPLLPSQV